MSRLAAIVLIASACAEQPAAATAPTPTATLAPAIPDASRSATATHLPDASPAQPALLVDPKTIAGYVSGRIGPEVNRVEGEIGELVLSPRGEHLAELRFAVRDAQQGAHRFQLTVPRALPLPMKLGERVRLRSNASGGGPNRRIGLVLTTLDGALLFAVNFAPEGWTVERGRRVKTTPDGHGGMPEHRYAVDFVHGSDKASVAEGWDRVELGGATYYVWGTAVERVAPRSQMLPPDYVGAWLDFAIVRAR